jgi:hypothetical protein
MGKRPGPFFEDQAANRWNTLRNQDNGYTAGQMGVDCFAQTARRFLHFLGRLKQHRHR